MFVRRKEFEELKRRVHYLEEEAFGCDTKGEPCSSQRRVFKDAAQKVGKLLDYLGLEVVTDPGTPPKTVIRKRKKWGVK